MKFLLLLVLCFMPCNAGAFDQEEYPLIDLRARSMRGGLGNIAPQPAQQQKTGMQTPPPQVRPPQQPVYYAPPPQPVQKKKIADDPVASDTQDIKEYIKKNPQVHPDV